MNLQLSSPSHATATRETERNGSAQTAARGPSASALAQSAELHGLLGSAGREASAQPPVLCSSVAPEAAVAPDAGFEVAARGPSTSLPYRAEMERQFGQDFSGVGVHLGQSQALAAMGARAAARGETVAFAEQSPSRELVAHELVHVVQSRLAGGASPVQCSSSRPDHRPAEQEAEALSDAVAQGYQVQVQQGVSPAGVHLASIYRGMTESGGKPAIGPTARQLGVRTEEVTISSESGKQMVAADGKGMSTADSPGGLPKHRRPPEHGGTGKDPVWGIDEGNCNNDNLKTIHDGGSHVTVAPTKKMELSAFQSALAATQASWAKVPGK